MVRRNEGVGVVVGLVTLHPILISSPVFNQLSSGVCSSVPRLWMMFQYFNLSHSYSRCFSLEPAVDEVIIWIQTDIHPMKERGPVTTAYGPSPPA